MGQKTNPIGLRLGIIKPGIKMVFRKRLLKAFARRYRFKKIFIQKIIICWYFKNCN